jgi:cysteine desulfurase
LANSETGILQSVPQGVLLCDMTQAFGKIPLAFNWSGADMAIISAHKLGGPKGIGALVIKRGIDIAARIRGGGQEMGRRSGTENIIGIAGFGAAAQAAQQDLEQGVWQNVEKLRNILEKTIAQSSNKTIFVGNAANRLPNTTCMITPGWKGETQVMQMDLAGLAVSAGSACSSGKVKSSRVLMAMGFDETSAASALRVSLGPTTTESDVMLFIEKWTSAYEKFMARQGTKL